MMTVGIPENPRSKRQTFHMCICISSALKNPRGLPAFTNDDGSRANPKEVKEFLKLKQAQGWRVLPIGKECDNFDKLTGCRGHEEKELQPDAGNA